MRVTGPDGDVIFKAIGTIDWVDPSARELRLRIDGMVMNLAVPPDSEICLNGERAKMRLLQSGDRAEVTYFIENATRFAHSVHVHWRLKGSSRASVSRGGCSPERTTPPARSHR